jgi:hypothetical protein
MANSIADLRPEFWAKEAQRSLFVENRAMAIANTQLRNILAGEGRKAHRTIMSYPASTTYTPGSDITATALTGSKETLEVDTFLASLVTIDDTEEKQSIIALGSLAMHRMMKDHNNRIEQAVLGQITNAAHSLDDGNVGGTSGNNMVLGTDVVPQVFVSADTKLDAIDAPKAGRTAVVGSHFMRWLKLQQAGRDTVFGDGVNTRGVVANLFGWDIIESNNLPYTAVLSMATDPSNNDTVTIAGVTFTFHTTLPTTPGGLHATGTVDNTRLNFANALNAPATAITESASAGYTPISAEDVFLLRDKRRITAVDSAGADTLTITGFGDITVAETFTAGGNVWGSQRQDSLFCVRGCVDQVVQMPPKVETGRVPLQFADIVKSLLGYGVKTYADGAREMVRVKINAGTSDWN